MTTLRIAGGTLNQTPLDWEGNTNRILDAIELAKQNSVDLLCLPELCITGYGCEDLFLSEWLADVAWQQLLIIREQCSDITVNVGLPIRIGGVTYNGACVISNMEIKGIALKQNMARDGVHYEPRWFDPWPQDQTQTIRIKGEEILVGDVMFDVKGIRFAFEICEDGWRKNKRPAYQHAKKGVQLLLNPSASHFAMGKSQLREQEVVLGASKEFHCVYVFANLLGNEAGRMIYDGDILIAQHGVLLVQNKRLSFQQVQVLHTDVSFEPTALLPEPKLLDNKDKNEELTQALCLGLYDYLRKSKSKGFVLSISGGADSATCAVMVAEMVRRAVDELGWDTFSNALSLDKAVHGNTSLAVGKLLTCAYQGTRNSSHATLQAATDLTESLGATFHHWEVDSEVGSYTRKIEQALGRELSWERDDISLQNIQARARSPIIWMLANVKSSILLTTSNRSEGDVGYATMDGDTSGSLAPIAGLTKPFILQWLQWAETELGYKALAAINKLKPTAELRPGERYQTDEDDLMPYTLLEKIERHAIVLRKSPAEVYVALKEDYPDHEALKHNIKKFYRLWSQNQWKRERLAPSFHLDEINVDPRTWCRFPILSSGFKQELDKL